LAFNPRREGLVKGTVNVIRGRLALAVAAIIVIVAATSLRLNAQASSSIEAFEVASIKPRTGEPAGPAPTSPDRFIRPDATLAELIRYAYNLQEFQIDGGPGWLASSRFDVNAKAAAAPTSIDGMRALVRRLLQDRFALKAHLESRELSLYEMVVARGDRRLGERLRPSTLDCEALLSAGTATADDRTRCDLRFRPKMTTDGDRPSIYSMTLMLQGTTLARLATLLQNPARRIVVDKTGLSGTFDLELEFTPQGERPRGLPPGPPPPPSDGPPLLTAIQEQLGLKLESVRGPVSVLIIENAELPTAD
jgi:uncharacterized protein (TIGR03435 family)